jgi:hypothetical protein
METYDQLLNEAKRLGIPTNSGMYKLRAEPWTELQIGEYELHRRITQEKRHRRENRLWLVALVSAIAAVVSAIGAWAPLFWKH